MSRGFFSKGTGMVVSMLLVAGWFSLAQAFPFGDMRGEEQSSGIAPDFSFNSVTHSPDIHTGLGPDHLLPEVLKTFDNDISGGIPAHSDTIAAWSVGAGGTFTELEMPASSTQPANDDPNDPPLQVPEPFVVLLFTCGILGIAAVGTDLKH